MPFTHLKNILTPTLWMLLYAIIYDFQTNFHHICVCKDTVSQNHSALSCSIVFKYICYSAISCCLTSLECWRTSTWGQKQRVNPLFDTHCLQLMEYTWLTAKFNKLWVICITTVCNYVCIMSLLYSKKKQFCHNIDMW